MLEILKSLIDNNIPVTSNMMLLYMKKKDYVEPVVSQLEAIGFVDVSDYSSDGKIKFLRLSHCSEGIKISIRD